MILILQKGEGEYDDYYESIIGVFEINSEKEGSSLYEEYREFQINRMESETGFKKEECDGSDKEKYRIWGEKGKDVYKFSFIEYLNSVYTLKELDFTNYVL